MAIKVSLGRHEFPKPFGIFWQEQIRLNNFQILPISISHAARVTDLPFHHRDPFDRLIIAQAQIEKVPVVSNDQMFDRYGIERIW